MGLFMHRDAGASRTELHPLPHAYRPPEVAPLTGEGDCEICGRERESIVHALQMVMLPGPETVAETAPPPAPERIEVQPESATFHWSD